MKKIYSLILIFSIIIITGCRKKDILVCNLNIKNNIDNYSNMSTYKVYYNNNYVTTIEKEEKYISSNKDIFEYLKEAKELEYFNLKDKYNGVIYSIEVKDDTVYILSTINLEELDVGRLVKDGIIDKEYVVGNKLTLSGIKNIYRNKGFKCEE